MAMMDPTLQRNMFKGQMPPVNSEGVGITDGLVENEKQVSAEALASTAEGMQNLFSEIDSADNPEAIMQALRGGDVTLESLRKELAGLVGKNDATKTPESVLTLLQPTMLMLEASEQVPEGGINEAMPIQAPGTDEASARIAMGEVPVNRKVGSGKSGENIPKFPSLGQTQGMGFTFGAPANNSIFTQGVPNYKSLNFGGITGNTQQFMEMYKPFLQNLKPRTTEDILATNQATLAPFLKKPRSAAEIEQELTATLGKGDADSRDMQLYLQLAKAGRDIYQSGEKPLSAVIDAAVDRVPETSQILAADAKSQRDIKLAARAESKKESEQLEEQSLKVALDAISTQNREQGDYDKYVMNAAKDSLTAGLSKAQINNKNHNNIVTQNFTAGLQFHGMDATTYAKVVNGKIEGNPVMVRRTDLLSDGTKAPNGLAMIKEGKLVALPDGYIKVGDSVIAKGLKNGTIDRTKAKPKNLLIPDLTGKSQSGYTQVAGEYIPGAGYWYYPGDGKDPVKAPVGFLEGNEKDILQVAEPDAVGRVFVTLKGGKYKTKSFLSGIVSGSGPNQTFTAMGGLGYSLEAPVYENNVLKSGNPLVKDIGNSGVTYASTDSNIIKHAQSRIPYLLSAISEIEMINKEALGDVYGPTNTIKAYLTNNVAALLPEGQNAWAKYYGTDRGRNQIETFGRKLVQAIALSDRYNVYEQQILRSLAGQIEDGTFFRDPGSMAVKMQNLNRVLVNDLSLRRNTIDPSNPNILEIQATATGTENDPFNFGKKGIVQYLQNIAKNDPSKKALNGKFLNVPAPFVSSFIQNNPKAKSLKTEDDGSLTITLSNSMFN